jgi:hypothetical protein
MGLLSILDSWLPDLFSSFASYVSLFLGPFLICFPRSTGSMRVQSKRATRRVALSETLSGCALGFFPEWHSYEPKTKEAQT